MSITFNFSARRSAPLTADEHQAVRKIIEKYSVEDRIHRREATGEGLHWESLYLLSPEQFSNADTVLEGHTRLPDDSDEAAAAGLVHWCNVVSALRRSTPKAMWSVRVENIEIGWDYVKEVYDPAK